MKQFWTKYPTSSDNFWGGFVIHDPPPSDHEKDEIKKGSFTVKLLLIVYVLAFIYGYKKDASSDDLELLELVSKYYQLFVSISEGPGVDSAIKNASQMSL